MNNQTPSNQHGSFKLGHLCAFLGGAFFLWGLNWVLLFALLPSAAERGQFGDMFGGLNALFTAFAFAALVYTTFLQRKELQEQREAQDRMQKQQEIFQEEQRKKQSESFSRIEESRQAFLRETEKSRQEELETEKQTFSKNVLYAIRAEIEAIGAIYSGASGKHVKELKDGGILDIRFVLTQNFFTVFEANAVNLGRVGAELPKKIISVYAITKILIEEFRINNKYLDERDQILESGSQDHLLKGVQQRLVEQARRVRARSDMLKTITDELFEALNKRGVC